MTSINNKYWQQNDYYPSFVYSKEVISHFAKSFSFASKLLPLHRRWATYSVYSFCRYADNIIDNPRKRTKQELLNEINHLREELQLAYKYGESEHPALKSFIVAAKIYNIPLKYPMELLDGVEMDLNFSHYENFDELYLFCYRVAAVVGLMMTFVLGFKDDKALLYAEKMGIAMQLTNILRDIKEDKNQNRIYLPIEELNKYNVTKNDFYKENFNSNFKSLMEFQVNRAFRYYLESIDGIKLLEHESRFSIYAAGKIYAGILKKLEERGYNPFLGRVFVPKSEKIFILISEFFKRNILSIND